jgi:hypothetical protein
MSISTEKLYLSLALYQVQDYCRTITGGLRNTEFNNIDYKSIKDLLLGLSYIDAEGYSPNSIHIFDDNNKLNYDIYKTAINFNLYKNLNDYDLNHPIFNSKIGLKDMIRENFNFAKVLDQAIESQQFGHKGSELLALIARRSNSLFKGITHRTIPNHLLDDYGIIKNNSELKIPFYNSLTTNIALAICFAFYEPVIHIPNPDLSGYPLYTGSVILGGVVLNDVKLNLQAIKNRIPDRNPKKLINFINDEYYTNTQMKINKLSGGKKRINKKGGAVLFKDSGHFFIINEIDPSLYAFDYFNFMLYGEPSSLRNRYRDQKGFVLEQEILFSRLTKFTKINFLGAVTSVNKDCSIASTLEDGEISLCLDGCLYNNKGKLSCSINILGENGLQDIKFFYGNQTDDFELHMSSTTVSSINDILGIKIYTCKLEPFDSTTVPITSVIMDDTSSYLKLLTTGEYLVIDDKFKEIPDSEIEEVIDKATDKYDNIFEQLAKILMDIVKEIEKICINVGTSVDSAGRQICETFENVFNMASKTFISGGNKISKIELIERIAKINPYIKGLSKIKKEKLITIYNELVVLNKHKKEELIRKYKIKNKNLKKNQIISMIFNSSNY